MTNVLSKEQEHAYSEYKKRGNVFITGPGGSGKSELIKTIFKDAIQNILKIKVTALTGCAAFLLECKATTVHSFFGIGISMNATIEELAKKALSKSKVKNQIKELDVLIVDEVSMMSAKLFNLLNLIAQKARKNNLFFGGIQIIFSGDFFQLPPIGNNTYTQAFCFESTIWDAVFRVQIELKTIFRQKNKEYIKILNQIRKGKISKNSYETLLKHVGRTFLGDIASKPTKLFPLRTMVDSVNTAELGALEGNEFIYKLEEVSFYNSLYTLEEIKKEQKFLLNSVSCENELKLKIGCQVICIINIDLDNESPLCNGSAGRVMKIDELSGYPFVKFSNGNEVLIEPHSFISENINTVSIKQLPLILAYSVSIHRSQGTGFEAAEIDIGSNVFENGQSYVALSRVKDLNGLYITSLDITKIKANPKVLMYYETHFEEKKSAQKK